MKKSDFYYDLPQELIAQSPIEPRDASRLLVTDRAAGGLSHNCFYELAGFLNKGDLLILNDSKVFPARLLADDAEILLLEQRSKDVWECIGRNLKKGRILEFGAGLSCEVIEKLDDGNRIVKFSYDGDFFTLLDEIGFTPLPPYITEKLDDSSRYNTIYANEAGSAAAPTAGLHFTERVFESLAEKGIETAYVTLHVGLGTFRPVKAEHVCEHKMHSERYLLPEETARKIRSCKARGNRVIAVGTTSCRTLEASRVAAGSGSTDIFITPGYDFKVTDGLITNFHLPESTLIMLVSAFLGRENTLGAYSEAVREGYRFFSFGDSMLIL
ncbi:MAG: tRNA preQ1(34) S-adenosylmethionine ribosyltransferase-isomerase QueA [Oscillospiraceae bacterium]|jgi:S-adenosylmethionine:tRNA ribosyltransferase-isomerase|nr:tRNA preQ1(34) S-adenosylmethionine ribosyltransferase-isomerase QueA [Oscillospiraceae bacterium]